MTDQLGRFRSAAILIAAIGMFGLDPTGLRAEVLAQAGTGITIEMGQATRLSPDSVHDRGIKLRAELDKAFNSLQGSAKAGHASEFSTIFLPYISAGMALEDAVGILRAAGFAAPPPPRAREEEDRNREADWQAVVAEIPQFSGRVFGNVEAYVMRLPPEQGLAEFAGRRHRMMYYPGR